MDVQELNIKCLPENYSFGYHFYHWFVWPYLMYVAEDLETGKVVGYVLGKLDSAKESEIKQKKAHITSLAVDSKYRFGPGATVNRKTTRNCGEFDGANA